MEILRRNPAPGRLQHAVFDFDGTLSLLRAGWQAVMVELMVDVLSATPQPAPADELRRLAAEPVFGWAGRPTLVQMEWLAEAVKQRNGSAQTAEAYKQEYLLRLARGVRHRADVEAGRVSAATHRVRGALEFVQALHERGIRCHIASGTDEAAVREEAGLLGFGPYVSELRGARADGSDAKQALTQQLTAAHKLGKAELAAFGDGRAEMACARAVDGLAIGLATDESGGGEVDRAKRALLVEAGADVIVADFSRPEQLLNYLGLSE